MRKLVMSTAAIAVSIFSFGSTAHAQVGDVNFAGAIIDTCALNLGTPGVLMPENNNTKLSSKAGAGIAGLATLVTSAAGAFHVEVEAPTSFFIAPAGADTNTTFGADYSLTGVTTIVQDIVASVNTDLDLGLNSLSVNSWAEKSTGTFPAGAYEMKAIVRCVAN